MDTFLERLHIEENDLETKINKLKNFFYSETFQDLSLADRILLKKQVTLMEEYHEILTIRIRLLCK
jgi:hypothetical protein